MQTWHLKDLPNDRHNPGRQPKVVRFCSPVEGKLGLGGRRPVTAAGSGYKGIAVEG